MADVLVDNSSLEDIADAIRSKNGTSDTYKPREMAAAIEAISGGGITPTGTVSITQNGTTDVTQYASASVNVQNSYAAGDEGKVVSNGALVAQTSDTVTSNDTYDTTLINSLTVNVSGGGGGITFELTTVATVATEITFKDFLANNPLPLKYVSGIVWVFFISDSTPTQGSRTYGWWAFLYHDSTTRDSAIVSYNNSLGAPSNVNAVATGINNTNYSISNGAITSSNNTNSTFYLPVGTVVKRCDIPLNVYGREVDTTEVT